VVGVSRKQHILREVDLDPVPLANGDRGRDLHEAVKNGHRRLGNACASASRERLGAAGRDGAAALLDLARAGDKTQRDRCAKDLEIVIIDLVLCPFLADLVETVKLVEVHAVAVGHDEAVENHGNAALLAEASSPNFLCLTESDGAIGDEHMLAIMGIEGF